MILSKNYKKPGDSVKNLANLAGYHYHSDKLKEPFILDIWNLNGIENRQKVIHMPRE